MRRVDEKHRSPALDGLVQTRAQLGFQELLLYFDIGFGRDTAYFPATQPETFFKNRRTWVRPRWTPVKRAISCWV